MFSLFKSRPRWRASDNLRENVLRVLLLVAVLFITIYGFLWNFKRQNELIHGVKPGIQDVAGYFSPEEQKQFATMTKAFKDKFGLKLVVEVLPDGSFQLSSLDAMSVYVGVSLKQGEALVDLPPWLVKLVGEQYVKEPEEALRKALKTNNPIRWRRALADVLVELGRRIEEVMAR